MRDIEDYTQKYLEPGFEVYQVKYRRKKVLEILHRYKPKHVLEIGCGMEPLFQYADWEYQYWTVVEPSEVFVKNAGGGGCTEQGKSDPDLSRLFSDA